MSWEDGEWLSATQLADEWDTDYDSALRRVKRLYVRKEAARHPDPEAPHKWQWKKIGG